MNIKGNSRFADSLGRRQHAQELAAQRSLAHAERWVDVGVAVGRAAKTAGRARFGALSEHARGHAAAARGHAVASHRGAP